MVSGIYSLKIQIFFNEFELFCDHALMLHYGNIPTIAYENMWIYDIITIANFVNVSISQFVDIFRTVFKKDSLQRQQNWCKNIKY